LNGTSNLNGLTNIAKGSYPRDCSHYVYTSRYTHSLHCLKFFIVSNIGVQEQRELGVSVFRSLQGAGQLERVVSKTDSILGFINRDTDYKEVTLSLYKTLVRSQLEHYSAVQALRSSMLHRPVKPI